MHSGKKYVHDAVDDRGLILKSYSETYRPKRKLKKENKNKLSFDLDIKIIDKKFHIRFYDKRDSLLTFFNKKNASA